MEEADVPRQVEGPSDLVAEFLELKRESTELAEQQAGIKARQEKIKAEIIAAAGVDPEADPPDEKEITEVTVNGKPLLRITQTGTDRLDPKIIRRLFPQIIPKVFTRSTTTTTTVIKEGKSDG